MKDKLLRTIWPAAVAFSLYRATRFAFAQELEGMLSALLGVGAFSMLWLNRPAAVSRRGLGVTLIALIAVVGAFIWNFGALTMRDAAAWLVVAAPALSLRFVLGAWRQGNPSQQLGAVYLVVASSFGALLAVCELVNWEALTWPTAWVTMSWFTLALAALFENAQLPQDTRMQNGRNKKS